MSGLSFFLVRHVVWDWNGTLLDDLEIVVEAVNVGVSAFGLGPLTVDSYRDHYTRPVKVFYDRLFGREVSAEEWRLLDSRFHDAYRDLLGRASLAAGAREALDLVADRGSQSLLSMFPHAELVPLVGRHGIDSYFDRIDGLRGVPGDRKAAYLAAHLTELGVPPGDVLVVGDTPDDAAAAAHVGAPCVLYDNGSHHRAELERTGARVVASLLDAVAG